MSCSRFFRSSVVLTLIIGLVTVGVFDQLSAPTRVRANESDREKAAAGVMVNSLMSLSASETRPLEPDRAIKARVMESFGKLSPSFEPNHGQSDRRVKFLSRGKGYTLLLAADEAVFVLGGAGREKSKNKQSSELRMKIVGANPATQIDGMNQLPGVSNYFIGNDPSKWRTNIPTYAKAQYRDIYPGVDMVFYGNRSQLEYDMVVKPGASPKTIRLAFEGARDLRIDATGALAMNTAAGEVRHQKPFIYQEVNGEKSQIAGRYTRLGEREIGFEVGAYDPTRDLVIDPTIVFTAFLGFGEIGNDIAVDANGVYITGTSISSAGDTDAFITRLNSIGNVVYLNSIGGSGNDFGNGIAVRNGEAHVVGATSSIDFPVSTPAAQDTYGGGANDAFVCKLDLNGSVLYSTFLGGSADDQGSGVAIDSFANAYVVGKTSSTNFPTQQSNQPVKSGLSDVFVTKFNPAGGRLFSAYVGGSGNDQGLAVAVIANDALIITGSTTSSNFPVTAGAFDTTYNGEVDGLVARVGLLSNGRFGVSHATFLGGDSVDRGWGVAFSTNNNVYVIGETSSTDFPTLRAYQSGINGFIDAFVTVFDITLSSIPSNGYSTFLGGSGTERGFDIAADSSGAAFVTGETDSIDPPDFPTVPFMEPGEETVAAFVTKISPPSGGGNATLSYSTYLGISAINSCRGIAIDSSGAAFVTGEAGATNFFAFATKIAP